MDASLVGEVVSCRHVSPSTSQSVTQIQECIAVLTHFSTSAPSLAATERTALQQVVRGMNTSCKWFPLYGCAILVAPSAHTGWCDLLMVYPDAWKTELMGFESDIHYFATPQDYTVLELGTIESDTTTSFFAKVDGLLENAQEKKGDARTAATMKQGHQKTLSFIQCLVREALLTEEPPTEILPFGGTTDVGQHTGFKPRATSWPFSIRLELLVWLAERQCFSLTAAKLTPKNINITFALLTYAVNDTLAMNEMGFNSTEWTDRIQNIRQRLDLTYKMRLERDAKSFVLDDTTMITSEVDVIARSKEMLVTWVAYCTIHHTCEAQHPLVREYKTALNWEDLRHLVLSDRKAIEALRLVAQYIRQRSSKKWRLFSIQEPAGTSDNFAREFAQQDERMLQRWQTEEHKLNLKMQTYVQEVRTKKARLAQLRAQTPNLERAVSEATEERDERYNETYRSGRHEYHIFRDLRDDYNESAHTLELARNRLNAHNREIQKS
ncbi:hypothetical protein AC1031_020242 [Aphanomyces cochlioides]|nr:hypothetical protein AC1031_020242 [Aphanomyces cochlioides]